MDFGGHDTVLTGNLFWKEGGDAQGCMNTWPYVQGHGTVYKVRGAVSWQQAATF
jgi:hypothetical protein